MHYKLTEEIIKLSVSRDWNNAKLEWKFEYAYQSEELETCLCGHYPIKNICVITNTKNRTSTEVGNCCINKFLGIEEANKIFTSINRIKEDLSKSMSIEVLEYLFQKKVITEFEYEFYADIIKKRKLSEKQQLLKTKINEKLLIFTSYENSSIQSKIDSVLRWAESHKWFDTAFIISLRSTYERKGMLSEKQLTALNNIISKNKIEGL